MRKLLRSTKPKRGPTTSQTNLPRGLAREVVHRDIDELKPFPANPRKHPESQIAGLMRGIAKGWTNPILIDEAGTILCGHGRLEAARRLRLRHVPTLTISGLSDAEKRSINISDNRLPERAVWDFDLLREHFKGLIEIDFDVELTGFSTGEIDLLLDGKDEPREADQADVIDTSILDGPAVSQVGDIWNLGRHRICCGDALSWETYQRLMGSESAEAIVTDPPFNVRVDGHVRGRGKVRHREFLMASGEMSEARFTEFLETFMRRVIAASRDGSLHYIFMDWRHLPELLRAGRPLYTDWKNLLVWNKSNAGQGSFYRSKHELIAVFKNGKAPHINNFGLGSEGRYRTNVLDYPGANTQNLAGKDDIDLHPTVKPIALIADLVRDCSRRNGIVLDPFGGSGTAVLAAERTGRVARVLELDPAYVDVAVHRWEKATGSHATHEPTGQTFASVTHLRRSECRNDDAQPQRHRSAGRR